MAARTRTLLVKTIWRMHRLIYQASSGRVWGRIVGMPVLILHTVGHKTGQWRGTMLTYIPFEDGYLIAASNGGADTSPDWFRNLQAESKARIQIGGEKIDVVARVTKDKERAALWKKFKQAYAGYGRYEQRTARVIPVILLTPD